MLLSNVLSQFVIVRAISVEEIARLDWVFMLAADWTVSIKFYFKVYWTISQSKNRLGHILCVFFAEVLVDLTYSAPPEKKIWPEGCDVVDAPPPEEKKKKRKPEEKKIVVSDTSVQEHFSFHPQIQILGKSVEGLKTGRKKAPFLFLLPRVQESSFG